MIQLYASKTSDCVVDQPSKEEKMASPAPEFAIEPSAATVDVRGMYLII